MKIGKLGNVEMFASCKSRNNFHISTFSHFPIVTFSLCEKSFIFAPANPKERGVIWDCNQAGIAQLVEHDLAKVGVA
ncbi:MAG: hypothetical protein WCI31_16805, partial [Prolixibacteraceae bacterium]